ncbi:hypothetical protein HK100_006944, partial [Physocladia obscura]
MNSASNSNAPDSQLASFFESRPTNITTTTNKANLALLGSRRSLRTSLLFQYALSIAVQSPTSHVVFICHSSRKPSRLPIPAAANSYFSKQPLDRVHIKYVNSNKALRRLLIATPTTDHAVFGAPFSPACIIVDDFSYFFEHARDSVECVRITIAALIQAVVCVRANAGP